MPSTRIALLRLTAGATTCAALIAVGTLPAAAAPSFDSQGYLDSTARCTSPDVAVAFGRTATSRIAICELANGNFEYRGVRVRDGAKLILDATSSGGGVYTAANDGITYTVSADDLTVSAGTSVIREEQMLDYHGSDAPASTAPGTGPASPTPTAPLGPPLPAEVGGTSES